MMSSKHTKKINQQKTIIIAIGGPTCSGKTTISKHLNKILPNSIILHQDDFAQPVDKIPINPIYGVPDWDDPKGAIDWVKFRETLKNLKDLKSNDNDEVKEEDKGEVNEKDDDDDENEKIRKLLPISHDHLNKQIEIEIEECIKDKWKEEINLILNQEEQGEKQNEEDLKTIENEDHQQIKKEKNMKGKLSNHKINLKFIIVEGFLLYWDEECIQKYDIKILLRTSETILKQRRIQRQCYFTQDGTTWIDPPSYWENVIWPSYILSHQHLFKDGNVINGILNHHQLNQNQLNNNNDNDNDIGFYNGDLILLEPDLNFSDRINLINFLEISLIVIFDYLKF